MSLLRGGVLASLGALTIACFVVIGASAASSPKRAKSKFTKQDRAALARQEARGVTVVSLLIATPRDGTKNVAKSVRALGGTVAYRNDRLGYMRVRVPIRKADQTSRLSGIQTINVDTVIPLSDPPPTGSQNPDPQPPPGADTPRVNPYMPTKDTGAAQFVNAHPTWDGRDTTIGILDTGVDLDNPVVNVTSTGQRKIVDWVTYTDPLTDGDPTWRSMTAFPQVTVVNGEFTAPFAGNPHYVGVPQDGTYRIARMIESQLGATSEYGTACGADLNRDGDCTDFFAILWRESDNTVYVDSQNDKNFTGEPAMHDYKISDDVNHFGTDNPATPVQESVPFVIQVDPVNKFVNIGIVSGAHGTHVTGIMSGNSLFGGQMSGAAPGAKVAVVRVCLFTAGCTSHALIEGMIYVVETDHVDVVNMSIGGLPALNDGNNTRAVLYNRLIEDNDVQMFFSAGNDGPGVNTIGDPAVTSKAMAVGAYITKETWQRNYGSDANFVDNLHPFSSRGPAEDGAFKPNIVAPGAAISSTPLWQNGAPVGGTYDLPPGYAMMNGTSMASPQGTGAAALLISAGKAQHRGMFWRPSQLRMAMNSTARFIPGYTANEQGNGLIDVGKAWSLLRNNLEPVNITSRVEVHTLLSDFLADPGHGPGIYDREGVTVGQSYTRTYTFTRTSGPDRPVLYHLDWVGNDGTFSTQNNVLLRPGVPTDVDVKVNPQTSGIHSAILQLDNSSTDGIDYETMNTVVAPDVFTAANGYTVTKTGHGRTEPRGSLLLPRSGRRPGAQGRPGRPRRHPGHGPGAVPALPSVGPRRRLERQHVLLRAAGRRLRDGQPAEPDGRRRGRGCLGGDGRGQAHVRHRLGAVHAHGVALRRRGHAQSGRDRRRDCRRAGAAVVLAPEQLRVVHRAGSGLAARQRAEGRVHDRQPHAAGVHDQHPGRLDLVPRDDRRTVRPGRGPRPLRLPVLRLVVHDSHAAGARARTETPRSRSRSRTRRPARGSC